MANTPRKKPVAVASAEARAENTTVHSVEEGPVAVETIETAAPANTVATVKAADLPRDLYVPCVCMIRSGKLIYVSKRTIGYTVIWNSYMDVQYIELAELMAMRSSEAKFFAENWIAIDDTFEYRDAVMERLRINDMYKNAPNPTALDNLFKLDIQTMKQRVKMMTATLKETVYAQAKDCIANQSLDSIVRIRALEDALGKSLI